MTRRPALYFDCTSTLRTGLKTGVQRMVRELAKQKEVFERELDAEFTPIAYQFDWYHFARDFDRMTATTADLFEEPIFSRDSIYVCADAFWSCDIFRWYPFFRNRGVKLTTVVPDLIPITHPQFVSNSDRAIFEEALQSVIQFSHSLACISHVTKNDLEEYIERNRISFSGRISVFSLSPGVDSQKNTSSLYDTNELADFFLMVGTVEPRKGYLEAIQEFTRYSEAGGKAELKIVGKLGVKAEQIQAACSRALSTGAKICIMDNVDDATLALLYSNAQAVICASWAEGYGLPLVEGLAYGKPVFANDIPIFREVGRDGVTYFNLALEGDLAKKLSATNFKNTNQKPVHWTTWGESAVSLSKSVVR